MSDTNIRALALQALTDVLEQQVHCDTSLQGIRKEHPELDDRDKRFLARLVEGTVERCIELDDILNRFSKVKVHKMKPVIRNILRMGVYQLKYMDSVPAPAACNEAVKLTVKRGFGRLKGFVNGVLRTIAREGLALEYETLIPDEIRRLCVIYSMPEWLVEAYIDWFGRERAEQVLASYYEEHPLTLVINRFRTDLEQFGKALDDCGMIWEKDRRVEGAVRLLRGYAVSAVPGYQDGWFFVQDASSQLAVCAAGIREGDTVVDVCGAPGGKSLYAAMLAGGAGRVSCRDVSEYKVDIIMENIDRMGMSTIEAKVYDALEDDAPWHEKADVVIADVPCSGLGVIGKKPDIKYHVTPDSLQELAALQRDIVRLAGEYVKPGGHLLYSTCTISPQENQENRKWIEEHLPYRLEEERMFLPAEDTDGFYYARFRKEI